jgi:hypothetical protein
MAEKDRFGQPGLSGTVVPGEFEDSSSHFCLEAF